jgi:iron complex outermembrane receptor protein
MKKRALMLAVAVSTQTSAIAQAADSAGTNAVVLDPVIVRDVFESRISINPNFSVPDEYNRVSPTSADGGEFLRQINGVSGSRFGGRGIDPVIRGQKETRLNILLDGAYIHGGCPNRMDPPTSWAALETYEEVVVIKGVQTLVYGGGGSGGTVLFNRNSRLLASEQEGLHGRVSGMATDNGITGDVAADIMGSNEKAYLRGIAQVKSADNYKDGDGREVRSSFDHKQAGFVAGLTATKDRLFEFTYEKNEFSDALYPGAGMDSPEEDADIYRLKYTDTPATAWLNDIKVEAYFSDVYHLMDNYSLRTPPSYPLTHSKAGQPMLRATPTTSDTAGGHIIMQSWTGNTWWNYGLNIQNNERNAVLNNMDSGIAKSISYLWPGANIEQTGVFAEAETKLAQKQRLKYGLRLDYIRASADKADLKPEAGPKTANQLYQMYYGVKATDQTETNWGGLLRYEHGYGNDMVLFAGISRSVRTADASERYMNKFAMMPALQWVGNPEIRPEKHHQIDFGIGQQNERVSWNGVLFYDDVSDYILRDTARGQSGTLQANGADIYRNVDAVLWGTEVDAAWAFSKSWDLSGALAYVRATNTTDNDRPVAQTPPLNGRLSLDYSVPKWGVGGRVRFAAEQDRVDQYSKQEVGPTPSYAVLDLYGNYRINDVFNLRAGVNNMFDETYAEHVGRSNLMDPFAVRVNEPGRTFWLRADATF